MRAVLYEACRQLPEVVTVDDSACPETGVVIEVAATGLCRRDWHEWMGHDPDIRLPHVPGHEFAGVILTHVCACDSGANRSPSVSSGRIWLGCHLGRGRGLVRTRGLFTAANIVDRSNIPIAACYPRPG